MSNPYLRGQQKMEECMSMNEVNNEQFGMRKPDITRSVDMLWTEIRKYADAYSSLKTAHGEMQQQLLSADKVRIAKEREHEKVLQEQKVLSDRVKALERSLHQSAGLQQEYDALKTEMQAIKRNTSKHDEELAIRQGQIGILEEKLALFSGMDHAMRNALSTLLKAMLDMTEFPQNEEEMRKATDGMLKHVKTLRMDAQERLEELEQIRSDMKNAVDVNNSGDVNHDSLIKEIADLKSENKDLLRALKQSEQSSDVKHEVRDSDLHAEVKDLQLQLALKQSDIEELSNRLKLAEDQLDGEREKNRDLKDQMIALRDLNPDAAGRQSSLESTVEKLRQERSDLQSQIEALRAEHDEKDEVIAALRSAKGDLFDEAGFTALKRENANLKAERLLMTEKFEELKQRLDKALNA
jgi:chromosome segregation ATPase